MKSLSTGKTRWISISMAANLKLILNNEPICDRCTLSHRSEPVIYKILRLFITQKMCILYIFVDLISNELQTSRPVFCNYVQPGKMSRRLISSSRIHLLVTNISRDCVNCWGYTMSIRPSAGYTNRIHE